MENILIIKIDGKRQHFVVFKLQSQSKVFALNA